MKPTPWVCSIVALLASLAVSLASADEPPQIAFDAASDRLHAYVVGRRISLTYAVGTVAAVYPDGTLCDGVGYGNTARSAFRSVARDLDYATSTETSNQAWQALPPADLTLTIVANGELYRCTAGGPWTNFTGPRLIESGRFVQRADVTDLVFTAEDGSRLNVEARFETVAWPDRLSLVFAARPGLAPIPAGEACFGRLGGGFGLDGTNHLEIPTTRNWTRSNSHSNSGPLCHGLPSIKTRGTLAGVQEPPRTSRGQLRYHSTGRCAAGYDEHRRWA